MSSEARLNRLAKILWDAFGHHPDDGWESAWAQVPSVRERYRAMAKAVITQEGRMSGYSDEQVRDVMRENEVLHEAVMQAERRIEELERERDDLHVMMSAMEPRHDRTR